MDMSGDVHDPATYPSHSQRKKSPFYHYAGGWVGSGARVDILEKRKIFLCFELNSDSSINVTMTMTVFGAATLFFQVAPQLYSRG
jgi:hypothetical protein